MNRNAFLNLIKHFSFGFIALVLVSCEEKLEFNEEFKYQLCIQFVKDQLQNTEDLTYIIDSEVKEFRFNDFYIKRGFKRLSNIEYQELSKYGFQKIDFDNAFLEHNNTSTDFQNLDQFNSSRNIVRFSSIKYNLLFVDILYGCDFLTPTKLKTIDETDLSLFSVDSFIIKFDDSGNATYKLINGFSYLIPCQVKSIN